MRLFLNASIQVVPGIFVSFDQEKVNVILHEGVSLKMKGISDLVLRKKGEESL